MSATKEVFSALPILLRSTTPGVFHMAIPLLIAADRLCFTSSPVASEKGISIPPFCPAILFNQGMYISPHMAPEDAGGGASPS